MFCTTGYFYNFIRDSIDVEWGHLVDLLADSELTLLSSTTHK
jgi:hypothetical protein